MSGPTDAVSFLHGNPVWQVTRRQQRNSHRQGETRGLTTCFLKGELIETPSLLRSSIGRLVGFRGSFPGIAVLASLLVSCGPVTSERPVGSTTGRSTDEIFFSDRATEKGVDFVHETDPPGSYLMPEIMGSGCALWDFDRDGDLDILLVNLGREYSRRETERTVRHGLYEQVEGGKYVDISERASLVTRGLGMGVAVGDVNNDGWPDVYLSSYGPDQLFLNRGDGQFHNVTEEAGIENLHWGASACFVDFDRDGWLDLFVVNYVDYADRICTRVGGGGRDYCGPQLFAGTAARLFRNVTGESAPVEVGLRPGETPRDFVKFRDISLESGIAGHRAPGLGVAVADFSGDGWPDLYVANDQTANSLWINRQNGTFVDEAIARGCAYDIQGNSQASMGIALGDPDRDHDLDLFLTHLDNERNTLYLQQPAGVFEDATTIAGLGMVSLPFTGFGTAFADLDLDGDEDLVVANGRVKRPDSIKAGGKSHQAGSESSRFWEPYRQRGQILLNDGRGKFQEWIGHRDGLIAAEQLSRGLAIGDIDNDGDLDLVVNRIGARAAVFVNEATRRGHWLRVKVIEPGLGGRDAYGALVTVVAGAQQWIRYVQPGTSYMSSHDPRVHFGLGRVDRIDRIEVKWPDGETSQWQAAEVDRDYVIERTHK